MKQTKVSLYIREPITWRYRKSNATKTTPIYECHLPSERPMIITFRDERKPEKPVVSTRREQSDRQGNG